MATKKMSTTAKVGIVAAAATAAAAGAAGYYFYASKDAKDHRKKASKWAGKLKTDVIKQAKKIEKLDRKSIGAIVDQAGQAYHKLRSVDAGDVEAATRELKKHWEKIVAEVSSEKGATKRVVKKAVKKAVTKAKATTKRSRT